MAKKKSEKGKKAAPRKKAPKKKAVGRGKAPKKKSPSSPRRAPRKARSRNDSPPAADSVLSPSPPAQALDASYVISDFDVHLFNEGTHFHLFHKLGAHAETVDGRPVTHFAVWAPAARDVFVMGNFNGWNKTGHRLSPRGSSGIWEGRVEGVGRGDIYKYHIVSSFNGYAVDKADPFAFHAETPPHTGSVVWDLEYEWNDAAWMSNRAQRNGLDRPISIYELHMGSWRRTPAEHPRPLAYREMAGPLIDYLKTSGFTHVEFMPLMEHPFYGSWGYQTTGYFAPTSRYGTPQDLMFLIDQLHQHEIGVIFDWVPSHFPNDEHGLAYFDGTHLFEHADPRKGFHPDWKSGIFNYGRREVQAFLISSAIFWLEQYHIDGLRVDAVASMLYLDYSREEGEWIPNEHGGRENLEAIGFLKRLNEEVYGQFPDTVTIAEESTAWPNVTRPTYIGGLGFGLKWDMGWMHDTLQYMSRRPVHRKYHQGEITFRQVYAHSENYTLPLSHDEVVYGKGSLIGKMPGDDWQKFANLRMLFAYMFAQTGKKLLFMGGEFGQFAEWSHEAGLDWSLLDYEAHRGLLRFIGDLNRLYRSEPALHEKDCEPGGFEWIDASDAEHSTLSFLRRGRDERDVIAAAFNFTPVPRHNYRMGVPFKGTWTELLNSDARDYHGSGQGNLGIVEAAPLSRHDREACLTVTLPPLGAVFFKPGRPA